MYTIYRWVNSKQVLFVSIAWQCSFLVQFLLAERLMIILASYFVRVDVTVIYIIPSLFQVRVFSVFTKSSSDLNMTEVRRNIPSFSTVTSSFKSYIISLPLLTTTITCISILIYVLDALINGAIYDALSLSPESFFDGQGNFISNA